jgi:hypothetical protein
MEFSKEIEKIEDWFEKERSAGVTLLKRIEPLLAEAEPVVKELTAVVTDAAGADPALLPVAAVITGVGGYLKKAIADEGVVDTFVAANATAPLKSLLLNAASLILQHTTKTGLTEDSDFDTAAQVAYATVKEAVALAKE